MQPPRWNKTYTLPLRELEALRQLGMTYLEARSPPDGYLSSWVERRREVREGVQWVTVQERGQGYAAEMSLDANGDVVQVVPLDPEAARALESSP